MNEPKSMLIGKHNYTVRYLPTGEGLAVLARLMNVIGPGLRGIVAEGDGEKLAGFLSELLSSDRLGPNLEYFAHAFRKYSTVAIDGKELELGSIYELHFAGNYFELIRWIAFCFEVNHASFLGELGVSVQDVALLLAKQLQSKSPNPAKKPG